MVSSYSELSIERCLQPACRCSAAIKGAENSSASRCRGRNSTRTRHYRRRDSYNGVHGLGEEAMSISSASVPFIESLIAHTPEPAGVLPRSTGARGRNSSKMRLSDDLPAALVIFRQLFDPQSSTYTYLLADPASREAVLIDPVFEQARRDAALLQELALKLKLTLETHVHADHITGAWLLKTRLGSRIGISAASGAEGADLYLEPLQKVSFGRRSLEARPTIGHTNGCMTYVLDDHSMAFTGDALFI